MKFLSKALCVTATLVASTVFVAAEPTLRVATGEYPPFTDETAADGGIANNAVAELANTAGLDVTFEYMPWMRSLELTRSGRFEATSYWLHSEEREGDFIHVGPILEDKVVFFRLADTEEPSWTNLEELSHLKIGAVTGYTYGDGFWQLAEDGAITVETAPNDEANMRKLLAGRIDLFPMSEAAGLILIERIFTEDERSRVEMSTQPLLVTEGYLLVSRAIDNAEQIAAALQAAVDPLETAAR